MKPESADPTPPAGAGPSPEARKASDYPDAELLELYQQISGRVSLYDTEVQIERMFEIRRELNSRFGSLRAELERVKRERDAAAKKQPLNTHTRLFDLVRQMRAELHSQELITDDEYAWLSGGAGFAHSDKGGSPSPRRLEDYDGLRTQLALANAKLTSPSASQSEPDQH